MIFIPISSINLDKSIWGDDSMEFKLVSSFFLNCDSNTLSFRPERWMSIPDDARSVPGVWGNLMTFAGGPRACIGFRFSLLE